MISTKTMSWTLGDGREVTLTVKATKTLTRRGINADGDRIDTGIMDLDARTEIIAEVGGSILARGSYIEEARPNSQGVVARIGKLGMLPEVAAKARALVAQAEADAVTPEYAARVAEIAAAEAQADLTYADYRKHTASVESMMTLGGRSC